MNSKEKQEFTKYEKGIPKTIDSPAIQSIFNFAGSTKEDSPCIPYLDHTITPSEKEDEMAMINYGIFSKRFEHQSWRSENLPLVIVQDAQKRMRQYGRETFKEFIEDTTGWTPKIDGTQLIKREPTFKESWTQWLLNRFRKIENRFMIEEEINPVDLSPSAAQSMMIRKMITKILAASNYLYHKNRRGVANAIIVNGRVASLLADSAGYVIKPNEKIKNNSSPSIYSAGSLYGMEVLVDPYRRWDDNAITIIRVGERDAPGLFLSYKKGTIGNKLIAEGTLSPKKCKEARLAIVELGMNIKYNYIELELDIPDELI